ncbi:MAG: carboxylate--amine ligase [Candidatus Wallbacteria bacterium HGW-Wallbacteria-1]|jgi:carbamoyl-phosphate synthase large subunit|uniref:Carboxylate--amine ligase n=1 Tax=Candidatus Wallbacteria bacterium HGW-Wallbacteria-1 TaxID=2013854 RepID=A0A2N1PL55_9BACT|nr:MAG: carboxylate--amine ligase [Candidatus Wallbacteria bacterium HGW-Wallbacteria-1]
MYTIAVSGINATDNPGPGLPVAKSLRESKLDLKIIGLSYDVNDPGHYVKDYLDDSHILPFPTRGWSGISERLLQIREKNGLDMVIPCLDAELPLFIQYADELAGNGIKTFLPDRKMFSLREKENLTEVAEKMQILHPKTIAVKNYEQLDAALVNLGLPAMIKGPYYKAAVAHNHGEAHYHFSTISAEWGFPILVQSMVSGEELNVIGLGDGEGGNMGMVAIKKTTVTNLGKIWSGVTIKHSGMLEAADNFIRLYKWRGPFELECIVSGKDINLIEINPRFPAWAYFATGVGLNLPERVVQATFNLPVDTDNEYQAGKMFMRYTDEKVVDIDTFQNLITSGSARV